MNHTVRLTFDHGTLMLDGLAATEADELPGVLWDQRVRRYRAPAWRYADLVAALGGARGRALVDRVAPGLAPVAGDWAEIELRPYQQAALLAWRLAGRRGTIVLPTGSGKTRVAIAAMREAKARALCLVPTRVLLHQWVKELSRWYGGTVGCWGDGHRETAPVTVSTYESAVRYAAELGSRFELLVVDEVHHFGARMKDEALEMSVAPLRLGLTATPPSEPLQLHRLGELVGPVRYELSIGDLKGGYLADYDVVVLRAPLNVDERRRYSEEQAVFSPMFRAFRQTAPGASWQDFVRVASRTDAGRRALAARRRAKKIEAFPEAKRLLLAELLERHETNRVLVFTPDNESAYAVAREHLVMPLTCDIKRAERESALERFRKGELRALVSSRVLNEGLDVPDADVAVVVGGALGEREHVQRVGRLLRPRPGKRAVVYELVASGTTEAWSSFRRRRALGTRLVAAP